MNQINADGISSLSLSALTKPTAAETELVPHVPYPAQLTPGSSRDLALLKVANQAPMSIALRDLPASIQVLVSHEQVATLSAIGTALGQASVPQGNSAAPLSAPSVPLSATVLNNQGQLLLQLNSVAGLGLTPAQQLGLLQQLAGSATTRQPWDLTLTPRRAAAVTSASAEAGNDTKPSHTAAPTSVTLRLQARPQLELLLLQQGKAQSLPLQVQRQWLGELLDQLATGPIQWRQLPSDIRRALIEQRPHLQHLPANAAIQLRPSAADTPLAVSIAQEETVPLAEPLRQLVARHNAPLPQPQEGRVELSDKAKAAIASEHFNQPRTAHNGQSAATAEPPTASSATAKPAEVLHRTAVEHAKPTNNTSDSMTDHIASDAVTATKQTTGRRPSPPAVVERPLTIATNTTTAHQADTVDDSPVLPATRQQSAVSDTRHLNMTALNATRIQLQSQPAAPAVEDPTLASALQKVLATVHAPQPQVSSEAQLQQELNAALTFHPLVSPAFPPSSAGTLAAAIQLLLGRLGVTLPEPKPTAKTAQLKETIHQLDASQSKELLKQLSAPASQYQAAQLDTLAQQKPDLPSWCLTIPLPLAERVQYGHCQIEQRHARRADGQPTTLWHLTLSLEIPSYGALLMEASLGPEHNKLLFHTPSSSLKNLIERFGTILRDRLKLQGVPIANFECHVGDIPAHLQTRGSALLQVQV